MPRGRGRGRPRKRLSRMDAAVDAMLPLGFPEAKVKKHVKELFEVYGGDEAWPFIEEFAYKVLIDSMLEEKDDEEQVMQNGNLFEDKSNVLESSGAAVAQDNSCVDEEASAGPPEMLLSNILESSGAAVAQDMSCADEEADAGPPETLPSNILESSGAAVAQDMSCADEEAKAGPPEMLPSNILESSGAAVVDPRPRRLPCYGWIDSDEDELNDDDFINLTPMHIGTESRETLDVSKWTKNRRPTRWDLRPDDP